MLTVNELLAAKSSHEVCTIGPDATVFDAICVFADRNLGALIVTENERLVGLVTERDYARKIILKGRSSKDTRVRDIMSTKVLFVAPDTGVEECMALMTELYIRHLPVIEGDRLVGIVSIGDVVKAALGERTFLVNELVRYITDSPMTMQAQRRVDEVARATRSPFAST